MVAIVAELVLTSALHAVDVHLGWTLAGLGVSGAQAMLQTIVTLTLSLVLFLGSSYITWSVLVLPVWIFLISIHILVDNLRRPDQVRTTGSE